MSFSVLVQGEVPLHGHAKPKQKMQTVSLVVVVLPAAEVLAYNLYVDPEDILDVEHIDVEHILVAEEVNVVVEEAAIIYIKLKIIKFNELEIILVQKSD